MMVIDRAMKSLERRKCALYRASVDAPDSEKICDDSLADMLGEEHFGGFMEFPTEITGITHGKGAEYVFAPRWRYKHPWVAVQPCAEKFKRKTYLGVYLGDFATSAGAARNPKTGVLEIRIGHHNPAIWIPDLDEVVWGMGSWWGTLKGPDDLRKITGQGIQPSWYMRAMRGIAGIVPLVWTHDTFKLMNAEREMIDAPCLKSSAEGRDAEMLFFHMWQRCEAWHWQARHTREVIGEPIDQGVWNVGPHAKDEAIAACEDWLAARRAETPEEGK